MAGPGMKPAPKFAPPGNSKEKVGKETPSNALIMDNLETLLATTVDKSSRKLKWSHCGEVHQTYSINNVWPPNIFYGWARAVDCSIKPT